MRSPTVMRYVRRIAAAVFVVTLAHDALQARQSCESFGPISADMRMNNSAPYDQIWGRVARGPNSYTFTWSAGQDVFARRFTSNLAPLGGDFQVNTTLNAGIQDEPEVCYSIYGNSLIAWSDRNAYDGQGMGIFGRVYGPNGVALGPEIQINANGSAGQWRPLIAPTPAGGYVVAWSGDWDGDAFFRIFDSNGGALSSDIQVNAVENNAQVDPAPAVNGLGTTFIAFVDFSGLGGVGTGLNLYGRTFTNTGVPREANEFVITSTTGNGDQREPRVAADGLNRFIVVWETQIHDGSGYGIYARRYSPAGLPLGPEFRVNSITAGDQRGACVAGQIDGGFVVVWNDFSTGNARIRGRRFDPAAQPIGDEFPVNENPAGGVARPSLAMNFLGNNVVVAYSGPGNDSDVFARRFASAAGPTTFGTPKLHSQNCLPTIAASGTPSLADPSPFTITASNTINQVPGSLYYSFGSSFTPFIGGTLYLAVPVSRTATMLSGGTALPYNCSGSFTYDFKALIQSGANPLLTVGRTISAQYIFRDPQDPAGVGYGLTNALRFTICP